MKLFDSELKVMEALWKEGDVTAKHISEVLGTQIGWNKNTSYTVIKKCMAKNAVQRIEPHFPIYHGTSREVLEKGAGPAGRDGRDRDRTRRRSGHVDDLYAFCDQYAQASCAGQADQGMSM